MTISVECPNGHKLNAKPSHAGRILKCPACGAPVAIPTLVGTESPNKKTGSPTSKATESPIGKATEPSTRKMSSQQTLTLLVGGGIIGSLVASLLLLVIWLMFAAGANEVPSAPELAQADAGAPAAENPAAGAGVTRSTEAGEPEAGEPEAGEPEAAETRTVEPAAASPTEAAQNDPQIQPKVPPLGPAAAEQMQRVSGKLKQIGLAFHNFHDVNRSFAFLRQKDIEMLESDRRPPPTGLSWRVHLLPYLDQLPLYERFHLDEPWDSEHNMTLVEKMPEIYRVGAEDETTTRFQVVTGPNALFGGQKPPQMKDASDGLRHTLLAVVTGPDRAITWTQPDELTVDTSQPVASLGTLPDGLIMCVMVDGMPLVLHDSIDSADFLALTTPAGREIIDAETLRRQFEQMLLSESGNNANGMPDNSLTKLRAATESSKKKLKDIVLAMQNYHSVYSQFPPSKAPSNFDSTGKPYLSWRVHLLPFLEQKTLYDQFKKDEPWDSPHNKLLIEKMPEVYRDALDPPGETKTRIVTLTGPNTPFAKPQGPSFRDFRDGPSATLLVLRCGHDKAVSWTQPADIAFDPASPIGCLGTLEESLIVYARVDGAVKSLQTSIPPEMFKAFITPAGGERLPKEFSNFEGR